MWNVDDIDSASVGSTSFLFHFYGVYFGSHRAGTCQSGQHLSTTCHHWECGNRRKRVPFSLSLSLYAFTEFSTEFRTRGPAVLTRAVGFLVDAVSHWFLPGSVMCYWTWYRFIFCGLIFNFFCGGGGGWGGASLSPAISAVVSGNRWKGLAPRFFFHLFTEFFYRVLCEGERPRPPKGPADWLVNVPPNKPNGFSINATRFRFLLPRRPGRHLENKKIPCRLTSPRKPTVTLLAR